MKEFEWELKNNKTGEVVMKGDSIKSNREHKEEDKEIDNSWRADSISDSAVKFVRNSNEDELLIYLNNGGVNNFELGESYNIEVSGIGEEEIK